MLLVGAWSFRPTSLLIERWSIYSLPFQGETVAEKNDFEEVGFIKYSGEAVPHGVIDAGSAGAALIGLDEAIRFFNVQQSPDLASAQYEIPVETRAGSWEAMVLAAVGGVVGTFALSYAKKAGEKMAENDFKDIGLKPVLQKSMSAIQNLAKLTKHTRRSKGWNIERIEPIGNIDMAVIVNREGESIHVPIEHMKWFQQLPPQLLARLTGVVRKNRTLTIGLVDTAHPTEDVSIDEFDKAIFEQPEPDEVEDDTLFPELTHGIEAQLIGRLIRGNEASNTVGLEYEGHVINCIPAIGSVRQYKPALFLRCKVEGRVTRHSKHRLVADKKPTLIVSRVIPLESDGQIGLFNG